MKVSEIIINELVESYRASLEATAKKDAYYGKRDAEAGIYDKWYRYNRKDSGAAYDEGWRSATNTPESFQVIEA